ncbi:hypothetical protein JI735_26900 [Paenibacillus sonchi]|uniref:Uncharacterized protein n=1 Tax=Paenibacillus sonchi TaxID=373687 RepID=A0A974SD97_9BACL|nr:hypothetical protein [Paenibacillus sonchi]QQZ60130.1 hypothetical protein JI735_26900 [Paenibacillus sonchi]
MLFQAIDSGTRQAALQISGTVIVSRGRMHKLAELPGYCSVLDGKVHAAIYIAAGTGNAKSSLWTARLRIWGGQPVNAFHTLP